MALTGICLVLFVTFHCLMNSVALIWPNAYNAICQFLGANWYALVASAGLALLFIVHIIYALWLTVQNRKARGADRYAVNSRPPQVEWASKNMFVLGIVVLAFLAVHMIQFWAKMQLQELCSHDLAALPTVEGIPADPQFGTLFLQMAFSQWWTPVVYIIGFVALWFHLNHGFWSMMHTIGWDNNIWIGRLKKIGCWWTTIVVALFIAQAVTFTIQAKNNYYINNETLQKQYTKALEKHAEPFVNQFIEEYSQAYEEAQQLRSPLPMQNLLQNRGQYYINIFRPIAEAADKMPVAQGNRMLNTVKDMLGEIEANMPQPPVAQPDATPATTQPETTAEPQAEDATPAANTDSQNNN